MRNLNNFFHTSYASLFYIIIFGTTLFFSTATRSVFEVNKLGIVKICLSLAGIFFFYDRLIGNREWFFNFKKNKTINITILLVWVSNALSTIFSKNIIISIFGCYDRWEGLITVSFYLFMVYLLINIKGLNIIKKLILAIILAGGLSSLYGIVQSFGIDIINWSLDPSMRVFGSINNPVHYCAIMGMTIPVIIGQLFNTIKDNNISTISWKSIGIILSYYSAVLLFLKIIFPQIATLIIDPIFSSDPTENTIRTSFSNSFSQIISYIIILGAPYFLYIKNMIYKPSNQNSINMLFNTLLLTIYTTYLSYSRATWLGLTSAIALIFIITLINNNIIDKRKYSIFCIGLIIFSACYYLIFLFNIHLISNTIMTISFLILSTAILLIIIPLKNYSSIINFFIISGLVSYNFLIQSKLSILLLSFLVLAIIYQKYKKAALLDVKVFLLIIIFMNVQFITLSANHMINFILLITALILTESSSSIKHPFSTNPIFKWKLIIISIFAITFISPKLYIFATSVDNNQNTQILIKNAQKKVESYETIAIKGSARTSMWKSSIPWFLDHALLGSGLDTIKYYYPKYRRPEYGKLEGGHNYTPDRLHNEYLNTLATKGIIGFITYYVIFIGSLFSILIHYIHNESVKNRFLIIGLLGGAVVYLGQVLFNFGVVATLVFFYLFLSLAYGLKSNEKTN